MNQEERAAVTEQATQRMVAGLQHTTNAEETIRSLLTKYGMEMYAAGNRNAEEWIRRMVTSLPIPMLLTRIIPEGGREPVRAYHWKIQDREGDGVTFAYGLEQALTHLMHQHQHAAKEAPARQENRPAAHRDESSDAYPLT